jgi:hypothetical protein
MFSSHPPEAAKANQRSFARRKKCLFFTAKTTGEIAGIPGTCY